MRYLKYTLFLLIISFLATSCSDDNDAPSTKSIIQGGKWKVSLFSDNGEDRTSAFSGYEFTFNSNGQVTAMKGANTVTGTWSAGADETLNKLTLNFGLLTFTDLNHEWSFVTKSYTAFMLQYLSSANGGSTDKLFFEKI